MDLFQKIVRILAVWPPEARKVRKNKKIQKKSKKKRGKNNKFS